MDIDNLPLAEAGGGDGSSWYARAVQEEDDLREDNKRLKQEVRVLQKALNKWPASTPVPGSNRPKNMEAVYKHIANRDLHKNNIATPALRASYSTYNYGQWRTLSNQVLAMITDYHTACLVNGPSMTCLVPSKDIEERLAP